MQALKLIACCDKCYKLTEVLPFSKDRIELQKILGNSFYLKCEHCFYQSRIYIDEVRAVISTKIHFLIISIIAISILFVFTKYGIIPLFITLLMSVVYYQHMNERVKEFNKFRIGKK